MLPILKYTFHYFTLYLPNKNLSTIQPHYITSSQPWTRLLGSVWHLDFSKKITFLFQSQISNSTFPHGGTELGEIEEYLERKNSTYRGVVAISLAKIASVLERPMVLATNEEKPVGKT